MQKVHKELELPVAITKIVVENVEAIKKLQATVQTHNQKITDIMIGFCLSNGVDLEKDKVQFNETFSILQVLEDIPETDVAVEKPTKAKKAKI